MTRVCAGSLALLGVVTVLGCGSDAADELGGMGEPVQYEAYDELFSPEWFGGIDYSLELGDAAGAKQIAASEEFKAQVDAFEQSELPSEWSDRTAEKAETVQALRDMIAAAEGNAGAAAFQAAVDKVTQSSQKLARIKGQ
ncbi:MAG: hypothetical protein ACREJB_17975 [Planctomycetaceae bacterium]